MVRPAARYISLPAGDIIGEPGREITSIFCPASRSMNGWMLARSAPGAATWSVSTVESQSRRYIDLWRSARSLAFRSSVRLMPSNLRWCSVNDPEHDRPRSRFDGGRFDRNRDGSRLYDGVGELTGSGWIGIPRRCGNTVWSTHWASPLWVDRSSAACGSTPGHCGTESGRSLTQIRQA